MVREKPPPNLKPVEKKKRARSKSVRRAPTLSPFQERLKDSEFYTKPNFEEFLSISSVKDRLLLIHGLLSEDVTDITRAWPLQLKTKDSRLRRELSDLGKECFVKGQNDQVLQYYNQALMYSSGKGIAHTLARRAAFLLSTEEHKLAVRDLSVALEYGGLETDLLDFLLLHHTQDEEAMRAKNEASVDNAINVMKNAKLDMDNPSASDISKWAEEIRVNLSKASKLRKNDPGSRKIKDDILKNIINSVKQASLETNLDENIEIEELEVPKLKEKNPLCPAFSEAAAIAFDVDKGRIVRARRAIKAGEIICVDDPTCAMLCPDNKENINSHCLNCFRFTKAPLPCDTCCSVVFCSKKCKDLANQTYHKYECQLKLYELFEYEEREVFGLFMALRAITQKPIQYFTENQKEIEKFLDLEEPTFPFPGRAYQSSDYRALCNLMTHVTDIDEDIAVKNSVLSVFFLRFLQKSGYFRMSGKTDNIRGGKNLGSVETFILRLIHQVICAQAYNSHAVHKITRTFQWEKIGTAINPSLALVNHSCDSNSLRCNVNKSSILVAARHIPEGEEITDTYSGHFRDTIKHQREYYTLKNYMFECECPACKENWPLEDDVPYELYRIPTFEQEKVYKVRHGDKKDLVGEVIVLRREVEKSMTHNRFSEALTNYQNLCEKLEKDIRRPHLYYLQARSGISHCVWNLYCTQFPEQPIEEKNPDEEDVNATRDQAKLIYKNNMSEEAVENNGLDLGPSEIEDSSDISADALEKAALMEATKKLLEKSSHKVQDALEETQEQRDRFEQEKLKAEKEYNGSSSAAISYQQVLTDQNGLPQQSVPKVEELLNQSKEEREEIIQKRQYEKEIREKEQLLRLEKRKQWDAEDKKRLTREKERKLKREQESQEKLKQEKEKGELKKKRKKFEEAEKIKEKQQEQAKKMEVEKANRQKKDIERIQNKKQEEEELQRLLEEIGDDFDIESTIVEVPSVDNVILNGQESHVNVNGIVMSKDQNASARNGSNDIFKIAPEIELNSNEENEMRTHKKEEDISTQISFKNMIGISNGKGNEKSDSEQSNTISDALPSVEPVNVWSSIRKIKEAKTDLTTIFSSKSDKTKEMVSMTDIDDMIKDLAQQISDKRNVNHDDRETNVNLSIIKEDAECDEEVIEEKDKNEVNQNFIINNTGVKADVEQFDYNIWKSEMDNMFKQYEDPLEKKAADEMYLQSLRQKIQVSVAKNCKDNKIKEKAKDNKIEKNIVNSSPPPKRVDDFAILKLKEKERKKKKQEVKFQQKVVDSEDKMKEMSLKTKNIEKISLESHEEIQKIRDMAKKLIARSEAKENEFNEIFLNLDNLDNISTESDKKKGKKGKVKKESVENSILTNEVHWTEEENNKWASEKQGVSKVTNILAALRAAAENGQSLFVAKSLQETISNAKKLDQDSQEEKKREQETRVEEEKIRKESEIKTKKNKENEEKKKKELEKEKKQKEEIEKQFQAEQRKEKNKKELELKNQTEKKIAEERRLVEERKIFEESEKKLRIEKEREKRKEAKEIKRQVEEAEKNKQADEKIQKKERDNIEAAEKKKKMDKEQEDEINFRKKSADLQKIWQEKERQRLEKEESLKKVKEGERLQRQEEYLAKMKIEDEKKKKEIHEKLEKERKIIEEEKAKEQKMKEIKLAREGECRKKEAERKKNAEMKLKEDLQRKKQIEEQKLTEEQERKDRELRNVQEERKNIEEILEKKKENERKEKEELEQMKQEEEREIEYRRKESERKENLEQKRQEEIEKNRQGEKKKSQNKKSIEREQQATEEHRNLKMLIKLEYNDDNDLIKSGKPNSKEKINEKNKQNIQIDTLNYLTKQTEPSRPEIEKESLSMKTKQEMKSEELKLKKLAEKMKKMDEESEITRIETKPTTQTPTKTKVPKPVTEIIPHIKESQGVKCIKATNNNEWTPHVVTVDSSSFMPRKNKKSEVQILKIGSPSQIRKAVLCDVKVEQPFVKCTEDELNGSENNQNYQITKIPTTIFEIKKPSPKMDQPKNYSITKVPTENIELENMSKTYIENVVKYSESKPIKKRSTSIPRPPPPAFKPPPPPPIF